MRHGLLGTSFAGLVSGPPACRPLLMPLRLSLRSLRKGLLSGVFKPPCDHSASNQVSARAAESSIVQAACEDHAYGAV
jgi:hypothetical protein